MMEMETVEVIEKEPCPDCPPAIDFSAWDDWSEQKLLCAILAELITMRASITEMGDGIAAIGSAGIGGLLGGLFGKKPE